MPAGGGSEFTPPRGAARGSPQFVERADRALPRTAFPYGMNWDVARGVGRIGCEKLPSGRVRWFVDFRQIEGVGRIRIYSVPGVGRIKDKSMAQDVLGHIQVELRRGRSLEQILAVYLPASAKPARVEIKLKTWLEAKERQLDAGDLSPTYVRELRRYCKEDGHFSWWAGRSIHEVDFGSLEEWSWWLSDRGLSPKTRHNVLAGFRSFLSWLHRRGDLPALPTDFPWPKVQEHVPRLLSPEAQDALLAAIPITDRGIFYALFFMGLRPGEARALEVSDYRDGRITINCKSSK